MSLLKRIMLWEPFPEKVHFFLNSKLAEIQIGEWLNMLEIVYDKQFDVLYLDIADNSQSCGAEIINGVDIFRDLISDDVTGFIIFGFMKRYKNGNLLSIPLAPNIDITKDVIPKVLKELTEEESFEHLKALEMI